MRSAPNHDMAAIVDRVRDLEFSDLYLGHPILADRFANVPGCEIAPLLAAPPLREDLEHLAAACRAELEEAPGADEFRVAYDGMHYRVAPLPAQGGMVFVVRRIAGSVPSLAELGIPQAYIRHMLMRGLTGLFIVSGALKSGKTMTACAMLKDRLALHGGVAVTGENPVELPLEGKYGHGICFQTMLPRETGNFADAMRNMMRWRAGTILIDEIRDQERAVELLKAGFNGYLVITTMLAEDVVQAVTRLHALIHESLGTGSARALLAEGLLGVLHLQMGRGAKRAPRLETELLFLKDAPATKAVLRKGEFQLLAAEARRQMATMINEHGSTPRTIPA